MVRAHVKLKKVWFDITHLATRNKFLVAASLVVLLGLGFLAGSRAGGPTEEVEMPSAQVPQVTAASVRDLSQDAGPFQIIGEVSATSQATVRTEAQGVLTRVNVQNGQQVSRGQVLVQIENSAQVAQLRQAEAALASAQASIDRSQTISGASLSSAIRTLEETQANTINSLQALYAQAEEAVLTQADTLFSNPLSVDPQLAFTIPTNQQEKNRLEDSRVTIGRTLASWKSSISNLTADVLTEARFDEIESYADAVNAFLARLSAAASSLQASEQVSASQISAWKGAASGARAAALSIPNSITGLQTGLSQAETNLTIAQEENSQTNLGGSSTAEASLRQAESAVSAAQVALAKTTVRAPISGTVSGLSVKQGDVVSPLQPIFTVSNTGSLEIITYVTEFERDSIAVGTPVAIWPDQTPAEITRISATVDPATRKIEVAVLPTETTDLIDGQSVMLSIQRSEVEPEAMFVPLSALKVLPAGFALMGLSDENTLVALPVEVGPIVGDRVLITSGVSFDDVVVTDVRGLTVGEVVELLPTGLSAANTSVEE